MYGDFSRISFLQSKHFSSVLHQQGRVGLDADPNENTSILLHYLRTLATDLIGPYGGPVNAGFKVIPRQEGGQLTDLGITPGHYYVDGLLVENDTHDEQGNALDVTYYTQPDAFLDSERAGDRLPDAYPFLVYLKVWERHISALEDPDIREIALGANGPDTATRTKVVWQIRTAPVAAGTTATFIQQHWQDWIDQWQPEFPGMLRARARQLPDASIDVCTVTPDARYRGPENQLYRVEIHRGGSLSGGGLPPTYKWARNNGTAVLAIDTISGADVSVLSLGRDGYLGVNPGDWVEIVDDAATLRNEVPNLHQVQAVDPIDRIVTLDHAPGNTTGQNPERHPLLRRWDQNGDQNGVPVVEATTSNPAWLGLEDGIQVQFQAGGVYTRGDYWLIPARTETGDVLWPGAPGQSYYRPPNGIKYSFAPLALMNGFDPGGDPIIDELRSVFPSLAKPLPNP